MSTEALKSLAITNRDASPQVKNTDFLESGHVRSCVGFVTATISDTLSTYRMCQVPSNARMESLSLTNDSMGTAGTADIGIWETVANGGAAVSATLFASAVSLTSAAEKKSYLFSALSSANAEKRIWELLALSVDPCKMYDIVIRSQTAFTAGGKLALHATYTI